MPDIGEPAPYEDESEAIPDDAVLLRRVAPEFIDMDDLDEEGRPRLSSAAFQDYQESRARELGYPGPAMSVHLASVLDESGKSAESVLVGQRPGFGLVRFTAGDVRAHSMGVQRRPTEDDPAHAVVFATNRPKRSASQQKRVRDAAEWIVIPR